MEGRSKTAGRSLARLKGEVMGKSGKRRRVSFREVVQVIQQEEGGRDTVETGKLSGEEEGGDGLKG